MPRRTRTPVRSPLADDTVIVRGGLMRLDDLSTSAENARRRLGKPGLSVYGADGVSAAELVRSLNRGDSPKMPYSMLRISTAGMIRRGGFEIFPTGDAPHQTIRLPPDYEQTGKLNDLARLFEVGVRRADLEDLDYSAPG